jgi:hypothetical protein
MSLVPCGCTSQHALCQAGQALLRAVVIWNQMVSAPDFPACSVEVRDAVFACYREAVNDYLLHCGCPVREVIFYEEHP